MVTLYKARVTRVNIRVFGIEYKELFQSNFLNTRLISIDSQPKKIVVVVLVVIGVVVVIAVHVVVVDPINFPLKFGQNQVSNG